MLPVYCYKCMGVSATETFDNQNQNTLKLFISVNNTTYFKVIVTYIIKEIHF